MKSRAPLLLMLATLLPACTRALSLSRNKLPDADGKYSLAAYIPALTVISLFRFRLRHSCPFFSSIYSIAFYFCHFARYCDARDLRKRERAWERERSRGVACVVNASYRYRDPRSIVPFTPCPLNSFCPDALFY